MLGDAQTGNVVYTGDEGDSAGALSAEYYRRKVVEFQTVLDALDQGANAVRAALWTEALPWDEQEALRAQLDEFEARRFTLRATAEAINAGAAAWNALGGRMPALSIPSGLGALPVIPLALIGAVATAATLIVWGRAWLDGVNARLQQAALLEAIEDPEKRAEVAAAASAAASAAQLAESSPLSAIAGVAKWVSIGAIVFLAVKAFSAWQGRD